MRILICILLAATACRAQKPEDEVTGVLKQMERAEQTGNADAWVALWSRETPLELEKMREYIRPRPEVHYTPSRVYIQGNQAALLGQVAPENFFSMRFVKEDGRWKIKDEGWSNVALQADMVYSMIPPADGAFLRAGSPWTGVAMALEGGVAKQHGWQMRTTFDESFLYIRLESPEPLPAPGSEVSAEAVKRVDTGVHAGWPVMRINISDAARASSATRVADTRPGAGAPQAAGAMQREYVMNAGANIGDKSTFDEKGKANSHFHFVIYSMRLERNEKEIFGAGAGLKTDPLVNVSDRFFDIRIPLRCLGIADANRTRIVVGDATWPKSSTVSVEAKRYQ